MHLSQSKTLKTMAETVSEMMKDSNMVYANPTFYNPDSKLPPLPEMQTYDIYEVFKNKFTDDANNAMLIRTYGLINERDEQFLDMSGFFDFLAKTGNHAVTDELRYRYSGSYCRVIDKVIFLARMATVNKLEVAVDRVCNSVNRLAKRGYVTAAFAPLLCIKTHRISRREKPKVIVVSYVAVTQEGELYAAKNLSKTVIDEGGRPNRI